MTADRSTDAAPRASELETLTELNRNYVRSVAESDVAWFDAHLSPDFLNTNPDGTLVDRAGFLAQVARRPVVSGLQCDDVNIRLFGPVAVIHARTTYTRADGQPGQGRFTDIWVRDDGRWLCVAAHVTRG